MALWVVIYHGLGFIPKSLQKDNFIFTFLNYGQLPVYGFIILSGFVTHLLLDKEENYKLYIKRRAFRLFPIYLIVLIISFLTLNINYNILKSIPFDNPIINNRIYLIGQSSQYRFLNILSHITLFHGLFPNKTFPFTYTIMGQSWSLTLEWQYYIAIPFIHKLFQSNKIIISILTLLSIALSYYISHKFMSQKSFLPNLIFFFLLGYFSKQYYNVPKILYLIILLPILFFLCIKSQITIILIIWLILIYFQKNKNFIFDLLLENIFIQKIGQISYSIYCIHMVVYYAVIFIILKFGRIELHPVIFSLLTIFIGLLISILLSYFTFSKLEKPFIDIGKKLK